MAVLIAWNGLPVALHPKPVGHSALFLTGLTTTLFNRSWAWGVPEQITLKGYYIKLCNTNKKLGIGHGLGAEALTTFHL